jgi:SAM-dependent methyltransferase
MRMSDEETEARSVSEATIWQRVEFGSYMADLPLWEELARSGDREGSVLELGAGSGRVAAHLGREGHAVKAIEQDPALAADLERVVDEEDLPIDVERRDLTELETAAIEPARLAIAPLHVVQQIDPGSRPILLRKILDVLRPGAAFAVTLLDEDSLLEGGIEGGSVPDMVDLDGWVYSSEPLWVQVSEETITVRRLRQRVSPGGEIERSVHDDVLHRLDPATLEAEADVAGLISREHRPIRSGPAEADSIAVILETR